MSCLDKDSDWHLSNKDISSNFDKYILPLNICWNMCLIDDNSIDDLIIKICHNSDDNVQFDLWHTQLFDVDITQHCIWFFQTFHNCNHTESNCGIFTHYITDMHTYGTYTGLFVRHKVIPTSYWRAAPHFIPWNCSSWSITQPSESLTEEQKHYKKELGGMEI